MIHEFDDVTEWLEVTSKLGRAYSPGGFAMQLRVSRSTVNNWIYRDKLIDYYKCKPAGGGEYGVIPWTEKEKVLAARQNRKNSSDD